MKEYPLDVNELNGFDKDIIGYWSKGHHDARDFHDMAMERFKVHISTVWFTWWRCVPIKTEAIEHEVKYVDSREGVQGSFPVMFGYIEHKKG